MNTTDCIVEPVVANTRPCPANVAEHRAFWLDQQPEVADITLKLPDSCIDELDAILGNLPVNPSPLTGASAVAAIARIPNTAALATEVTCRLEETSGAVLIDRFPAERYTDDQHRLLCGLFASMVAPLMAQDFSGTTLYDVMDKRVDPGIPVRRSVTNLRQDYHTDGGWVATPARHIGLYCIRNAQTGGYSRVTSLLAAYDSLSQTHPDAMRCLSRPHPWDRQGEHDKDELPYAMNPVFVKSDEGFLARFYESYVRNGYQKMGTPIDSETDAALTLLAKTLDEQQNIRFLLEAGQFQYVNNYTLVHGRESFEDSPADPTGRRLIRVWHC